MASWDCFSVLGDELVKVSQRVGESWEWKILSSDYGCKYLQNTSHVCNGMIFHLHILFSPSYSCPVLYFNVYEPDGRLLQLQEIWNNILLVGSSDDSTQRDSLLKTVTQSNHPLLNIPFYMIHPCETSSFMNDLMKGKDENKYLISWLSLYGVVANYDTKYLWLNWDYKK